MYNQLMDVMSRLDSFEKKYKQGTAERKEVFKVLKKENNSKVIYGENVKVQATMLYSEGVWCNVQRPDCGLFKCRRQW